MIPLVAVGIITIVIASLVLMNSSIDNQQELSQINLENYEMYNEIAAETHSIKGVNTSNYTDGTIQLSNTSNEEIKVIQIRVYDDDGNYVESFDVDYIMYGNTVSEITDLPIPLREMLRD